MDYVISILFAIVPIVVYRIGYRDALAHSQCKVTPEKKSVPIEARSGVETTMATDEFLKGVANIFSYDGTAQKKEVDE